MKKIFFFLLFFLISVNAMQIEITKEKPKNFLLTITDFNEQKDFFINVKTENETLSDLGLFGVTNPATKRFNFSDEKYDYLFFSVCDSNIVCEGKTIKNDELNLNFLNQQYFLFDFDSYQIPITGWIVLAIILIIGIVIGKRQN